MYTNVQEQYKNVNSGQGGNKKLKENLRDGYRIADSKALRNIWENRRLEFGKEGYWLLCDSLGNKVFGQSL